jgi:DNA-binding NtrC family response regulator
MAHKWPGNVRELKNVMERATSLCDGDVIQRSDLHLQEALFASGASQSAGSSGASAHDVGPGQSVIHVDLNDTYKGAKLQILDQFEREYIRKVYEEHDGNISKAARSAGLTRYHLRELLKKHEVITT